MSCDGAEARGSTPTPTAPLSGRAASDVGALEGDRGREAMPSAGVVKDPAQGVITIQGHEGLAGQFVKADQLPIGQRMLSVNDGAQWFGEQFVPPDHRRVIECRWITQAYVDDTIGQIGDQLELGTLAQFESRRRMAVTMAADQPGHGEHTE